MTSKRISMSLFDDELKNLINASAKIFPISQQDVDTNLNPNNYEYGRIDRSIYIWHLDKWEYVIADDININWTDVLDKPASYTPSEHGHTDLHTHVNKSIIDTVSQILIDSWNGAVSHMADAIKHITSGERTLWNTVSGKAESVHSHNDIYFTEEETNTLLNGKSDTTHNHTTLYSILSHDHDGRYFTESETNTLLGGKAALSHNHTEANITDLDKYTKVEVNSIASGKSDTGHTHTDLHAHANKTILDKVIATDVQADYDLSQLQYIEDIRAGYTEGHSHSNLTVLADIDATDIANWDNKLSTVADNSINALQLNVSGDGTTTQYLRSNANGSFTWVTPTNTTYTEITTAEIDAGTATTLRTITGRRVAYIIGKCASLLHTHTKADITDFAHDHDSSYYTESEINTQMASKAEATTLSGHTGNTTVHVTQLDKDAWNAKSDTDTIYTHPTNHPYSMLTDTPTIPTALSQLTVDIELGGNFATIGIVKPTDGSMWYQEI